MQSACSGARAESGSLSYAGYLNRDTKEEYKGVDYAHTYPATVHELGLLVVGEEGGVAAQAKGVETIVAG